MNRKSALDVRESGRDLAEEIVYKSSADFAAGREHPVSEGNSRYFSGNPVFDEQAVTPKFQFPISKFQLSANYQSTIRRTSDCPGFCLLAFGVCPAGAGLLRRNFSGRRPAFNEQISNEEYRSFGYSCIHPYMQKRIKKEVETMLILKVKARRS